MHSQQTLLDLKFEHTPSLNNFVAGDNAELIARLRELGSQSEFAAIYLWGPLGSGRTHLLTATALLAEQSRPVVFLRGLNVDAQVAERLYDMPSCFLVIDDVDTLNDEAQSALFRIFNSARYLQQSILLSGPQAALHLPLREDLRTRIGQALIYEVKPLSDEEKTAALRSHAQTRGITLDDSIVAYLLRHARRDLPSLLAVLDRVDRSTLEQQRPLTLPLLREILQQT